METTVDAGAASTTSPDGLLYELGIEHVGKRRFLLDYGWRTEMDYRAARARVDGESRVTLVAFGVADAMAQSRAYTSEGLAVSPDSVENRPIPGHLIVC